MPLKVLAKIKDIIPQLIDGFKFLFVSMPKNIFQLIKNVTKFIEKTIPIAFAVILTYFLIFFGLQILITKITKIPGLIPHSPLALLSLLIVYNLVSSQGKLMETLQLYILKVFLMIFDNPLTKELFKFDVKINEKKPAESMMKIIGWSMKNIISVSLTLIILSIILNYSVEKIWDLSTTYVNSKL